MFNAWKTSRLHKKLNKRRIKLSGVQSEIIAISKIIDAAQKINYGQSNRLPELSRMVGELQTEIAILEDALQADRIARDYHNILGDDNG